MSLIKVMVSSTIRDLYGERDAVKRALSSINLVNFIGADPFNDESIASSSHFATLDMAKQCDLYILILGNRFGMELTNGKSATEIEFDSAFRDDPTKILVFKKDSNDEIEDKQKLFIDRVSDYYHGYWRTTFEYTHQLQELVINSFNSWLKNRASIGTELNYMDHFIRIAKQKLPEPTAQVYYKVTPHYVELEYVFFGKKNSIQFDREHLYSDFWGCLHKLEDQFFIWLS